MRQPTKIGRFLLFALLLFGSESMVSAETAATKAEIRVLIDVSGSMKHNDPQNLRHPAWRLLANLLPSGMSAGAWLFAETVDELIPSGLVDDHWRQSALAASGQIHSRGLFTDIDKALRTVTTDWRQSPPDHDRLLILLTDGMVDVDQDESLNAASRADILSRTLPELQAADITLHALALSDNTDAELLRNLAEETGGSFHQIMHANKLERLFLHIFERTIPHDALPLIDNAFQVDRHIAELTLLAFHAPDADPIRLITPGGSEFSADSAPQSMRWHRETNHDLITITNPETGHWQLLGADDPDNRALILTDLQLQVEPITDTIFTGEPATIRARLTEGENTLTQPELLALTTVDLHGIGDIRFHAGKLEQSADDDSFTMTLDKHLQPGMWQLIIRAQSPTFTREQRLHLSVLDSPISAVLETDVSKPHAAQITLAQTGDRIKVDTLQLTNLSINQHDTQPALQETQDGWQLSLEALDRSLDQKLELQLSGETQTGRHFRINLPLMELAADPSLGSPDHINWPLIIIVLTTANLCLLILALLAYQLYRARRAASAPAFKTEPDDTDLTPDGAAQ